VTDTPRIAPLPKEEWSEEEVAALRAAFGEEGSQRMLSTEPDAMRVPNVLTTMLRHPTLAGPFLTYNNVLLWTPAIEPRLRELMILRVAARTRSKYEWIQHVRMARRCDISEQQIDAVVGKGTTSWTPLEASLLAATDQMIDRYCIDDATWAELAEHFDERQLIEVAFVIGTYMCLAMVFNTVGLQLDPELHDYDAPPLPD